ncbi:hypothetical protein [Massilia horti]|uniref:Uncharacterized protein n=1 Tax=Massilia horti TaxID=2562153 RepID=A0A4Y9SNZ3_9BURK|nr:hypothetical protein [Massilia horti]TFW28255.1 hypothetical protein E4O92_21640 [Massilia horti]
MNWRLLFQAVIVGTARNVLFCSLLLAVGYATLSLFEWRNAVDWTNVAGMLYAVGALSGAWEMWNCRGRQRMRFLTLSTLQAATFGAGNAVAWTLIAGFCGHWEWGNIGSASFGMGALAFFLTCFPLQRTN